MTKKYKIKEYPTLILLDSKAEALRTVIGFSWFETPNLYMTQKLLLEGGSIKDFNIVSSFLFSIVANVMMSRWISNNMRQY